MRIKTPRFDIIPYDHRQLKLSIIDPAKAAAEIGAVIGAVSAEELAAERQAAAMKLRIIDQNPDAWLFSTNWQIVSHESGQILGMLGFKGIHPGGETEIGYATRSEHRCRGIMTEAVEALCRFAFSQSAHPIGRISALTREGNLASERVLEKNGFVRDGTRFGMNYWVRKRRAVHDRKRRST